MKTRKDFTPVLLLTLNILTLLAITLPFAPSAEWLAGLDVARDALYLGPLYPSTTICLHFLPLCVGVTTPLLALFYLWSLVLILLDVTYFFGRLQK